MVEYIASKGQRTFSDSERELLFGKLQQFLAAQNHR
jgi:hypothetical protein